MENIQTDTIAIAPPNGSATTNLELAMGAGTLTVNPGAVSDVVHGTISYNVPEFKPIITIRDDSVRIEQGKFAHVATRGNIKNDWDLQLGSTPIALSLSIGAAKVRLELGGLALANLSVTHGASDFALSLTEPNSIELDGLHFKAGASKSVFRGLANLNAHKLEFKGGAGTLSLEFSGALRRDLAVSVTAAAGNVVVLMPAGIPAEAALTGVMSSVSTAGSWNHAHRHYVTAGDGPSVTIDVKMSVGSLELRNV